METQIISKLRNSSLADNERSKTSFLKDGPKITRYTLADVVDEQDHRMDYNIQMITKADREKVLNFLRKFFFRDEPLNHCIGLIPEGENSTCVELEDYSMSAMNEDFSCMAVAANGSVIGVILNGSMGPMSKEEPHYIVNCANPKFKKILKLLYCVEKNSNIPEKFPDQKVLEIRIISVDSNWRGKGIAKALFEKTMEVAKNRSFDIIRVDCSSAITGKLCQRLGFEPVFELKYVDYVDEAGNPIFTPAPPHEAEVFPDLRPPWNQCQIIHNNIFTVNNYVKHLHTVTRDI